MRSSLSSTNRLLSISTSVNMTNSFEGCLDAICKEIALSASDRQSFNKDAQAIRNNLMEMLQSKNDDFKKVFNGLSLTGSYLDSLKIDLPDEFDLHIKLDMPFAIRPYADPTRPGFIRLAVEEGSNHPIVRQRRISRHWLQDWIRNIFSSGMDNGLSMTVSGRHYCIEYTKYGRGSGVAHTVIARSTCGREISFDFVPVFEFAPHEWPFQSKFPHDGHSWFAVPFGKKLRDRREPSNKCTFMACALHWERNVLHNKMNLKNSLRILKALRDCNKLERLSSYMLKSIYLEQVNKRKPDFWEKSPGVILIAMVEVLSACIESGILPFFLHRGINHLDMVPKAVQKEYDSKIRALLNKLISFQSARTVKYADIESLFISRKN